MYIASVFKNSWNQTAIIMKLLAKDRFSRLWIMLLFISLSMISISAVSSAISIGEQYQGGIVFYVDGTGQHGLVAAKEDMRGHSPDMMKDGNFNWSDAKEACNNLVSNGYSDWFLPNEEQLNQLYLHQDDVGGFAPYFYWSSTEIGDLAGCQYFGNKNQGFNFKMIPCRVRPVRAF